MIRIPAFLLLLATGLMAAPAPIPPEEVVIVYNQDVDRGKELAEFYAVSRRIPPSNIVALSCTEKATIDRKTYEEKIRNPLRKKFIEAGWWTMGKNSQEILAPIKSSVRYLVVLKGMPLRISRQKLPEGEEVPKTPHADKNEAAIDSELSFMGISDYPIGGPLPNPYFNKDHAFSNQPGFFQLLVGRIDAPTFEHCQRMILDALDVEKSGLWGRAYVDFANKGGNYAIGDQWMEGISKLALEAGIPTVVDKTKDTFVTNYPMTDAALYFGWYTQHRNGPFLNEKMTFKPGAIAVHLHSFSAAQLLNPAQNWSAGLIDRGAAATLGNTWEPYLQLSHNFEIFFDRLLKGYTLVEASSMAMNAVSWQNIVIGDPLYRPFKISADQIKDFEKDLAFKALRLAQSKWPDPTEREQELVKAADRMKSGSFHEFFGYQALEAGDHEAAAKSFKQAGPLFKEPADKLRQLLNLVEIQRRKKETAVALQILRSAKASFKDLPEATAIDGLITILDPPAPPPAKKSK